MKMHLQTTLNCRSQLLDLEFPQIMGIINLTPDSFYDGGQYNQVEAALTQAGKMLEAGASIIDLGPMSSKPGSDMISEAEEWQRLEKPLEAIIKSFPKAILSIDTYRAGVAKKALDMGAHIINDITAGNVDEALLDVVAEYNAPYILMHMQGLPKHMQDNPTYDEVLTEVMDFMIQKVGKAKEAGIRDIIIDPGFGFGKTIPQNYHLLQNLNVFQVLGKPILVGLSRKSMIYKSLDRTAEEALNGTTALHMAALQYGANILRVHDVKEAVETVKLFNLLMDQASQAF